MHFINNSAVKNGQVAGRLLTEKIEEADAVFVVAGSGISTASGFRFYYDNNDAWFEKYFGDLGRKYGYRNAYYGSFFGDTQFYGRMTLANAALPTGKPYTQLKQLLEGKDTFIWTTNIDGQFARVFSEEQICTENGDSRYMVCPRERKTWSALEPAQKMYDATRADTSIPEEAMPKCPSCGADLFPWTLNNNCDLHEQQMKYMQDFLHRNSGKKILFLEIGVHHGVYAGLIRKPARNLAVKIPQAFYMVINLNYEDVPHEMKDRGIVLQGDVAEIFENAMQQISK